MINQQFGIYLVLEKNIQLSQQKKRIYWKCECQKCKSIQNVRTDSLKRLPNSCPECKNSLLGKRFGKLLVLKKGKIDNNGHAYWICQCDCGNKKEINGSNLISGYTQSCGCLHSKKTSELFFQDLTGLKFNKLTVLKRITPIGQHPIKWLCKCDCGTIIEVQGNNLKNNHTTSCGCSHSLGEEKIRQLLNSLNISFKTEYVFNNLKNRRFDFFLPDYNICIEYNGKQHYSFIKTWHETEEKFLEAQNRDLEKIEFCKLNNIKLIIIPYTDYDKLNNKYILSLLGVKNESSES